MNKPTCTTIWLGVNGIWDGIRVAARILPRPSDREGKLEARCRPQNTRCGVLPRLSRLLTKAEAASRRRRRDGRLCISVEGERYEHHDPARRSLRMALLPYRGGRRHAAYAWVVAS